MSDAWRDLERSDITSNRIAAIFVLAGVATFAFFVFHHFYGRDLEVVELQQSAIAEPIRPVEDSEPSFVDPNPDDQPLTVAPGQRVYGPDGTTYIGVYQCQINGQRVVSDRPCGAIASTRVIEVSPATATAPPIVQYRQSQPPSASKTTQGSGISATGSVDNSAACAAIDRAIENLNARMRQSYTSQQGEWYRRE